MYVHAHVVRSLGSCSPRASSIGTASMKTLWWTLFVLLTVAAVALGDRSSSAPIKKKRGQSLSWVNRQKSNPFVAQEKKMADLLHEFDETVSVTAKEAKKAKDKDLFEMLADDDEASDNESESTDANGQLQDPCLNVACSAGRECRVNSTSGEAQCLCVNECGYEADARRKVCSNYNETFSSDCELYRMRCLCEEGDSRCSADHVDKYKHTHVEYYGECRVIPDCSREEMEDFPRRMREWLFNVMKELADRRELSYHYQNLEKEAENDQANRWRNAAIWKWCDLDLHPHDNVVSRHELFPVKAPLQTLEHCIATFLDGCDVDDDHQITLKEWGTCLGLKEEEMINRCEELSQEP